MRNREGSAKPQAEPFEAEPDAPPLDEARPRKRLRGETPGRNGANKGLAAVPGRVAMLLLALAASATIFLARPAIVTAAPQAAGLYALIGWPVNLRGLALREVKSALESSGGSPLLVVEGEIVNVTRGEVAVPPLELVVRAADGQALYTWTNDAPRKTLESGGSAVFRARLASPPAEGRDVLVRFASASEGQAVAAKAH